MDDKGLHDPLPRVLLRGMRSTVGRESTTFGFSILVTVTFGLMQTLHGTPDTARVFAFAVGAGLSFTVLEGVLSRGFREPMPQHGTHVQAIGASMNLISVLSGLAVACLIGATVSHAVAWTVAPLLAAVVYLVLESAETAVAERMLARRGDTTADEVTP